MATASYDHHIVIYEANELRPVFTEDDQLVLDETDDISLACEPTLRYTERYRIHVSSNPEAVVFHPSGEWVMYTLRDSHLLHYIRLPRDDGMAMDGDGVEDWESQTKSFNPHPMDTHVSFSVLDLAIHPSGKVIACLTGDHRGGSGERVLLYGIDPEEVGGNVPDVADWPDRPIGVFVDRRRGRRFCSPSHVMVARRDRYNVSARTSRAADPQCDYVQWIPQPCVALWRSPIVSQGAWAAESHSWPSEQRSRARRLRCPNRGWRVGGGERGVRPDDQNLPMRCHMLAR
jgi:hypothetical protein